MTLTLTFARRALLVPALFLLASPPALANITGITGRSGKQGGTTCVECHAHSTTGEERVSMVIEDSGRVVNPATEQLLHTKRYTLRLRATYAAAVGGSGVRFGFNVATGLASRANTRGVLQTNASDTGVRIENGEATHTMPRNVTGGQGVGPYTEWLVDWTPPALAMGASGALKVYASMRRAFGTSPSGPPNGFVRSLSPTSNGALSPGNECGPAANGLNPNTCGLNVNVTPTTCMDADGDGWLPTGCFADRTNNGGDCNDNNANVNPAAVDACNGVDDDCDGMIDEGNVGMAFYPDADGDTYGSSSAMAVMACDSARAAAAGVMNPVQNRLDCNDMDAQDKPMAMERCDGVDNNCNGMVDEGIMPQMTYYPDADQDGYGSRTATPRQACSAARAAVAFGVPAATEDNTDCNDMSTIQHPGFAEICDGIDNDCTGGVDNGLMTQAYYPDVDMDTFGNRSAAGRMACDQVQAVALGVVNAVLDNTDCNDTQNRIKPTAMETCDSVDEDCDGMTDEGFQYDFTALGQPCDSMEDPDKCKRGTVECSPDHTMAICANDPPSPEICDGMQVDNDCDDQADQAVFTNLGQPCGQPGTCNAGFYACNAQGNDTYCRRATGDFEICGNFVDDDCDGVTDGRDETTYGGKPLQAVCDSDSPLDPDRCENGIVRCFVMPDGNNVVDCFGDIPTPELCENGTDDDCDLETDEFPCDWPDAGPPPDAADAADAGEPDASDAGEPDAADAADAGLPDAAVDEPDAAIPVVGPDAGNIPDCSAETDGCCCDAQPGTPTTAGWLSLAMVLMMRRTLRRR